MPDRKDDVPLPSGGFKEPAILDDDEQNEEVPAETDGAPEVPLDDLMGDETVEDEEDDEQEPRDE